jgi:sodium transport system permease protein
MTRALWGVVVKEWLDAIRDRRSLTAALSYVVAGPLAMGLALTVTARETMSDGPLTIAVEGGEHAPAIVNTLRETIAVEEAPRGDGDRLVRTARVPIAIVIDPAYGDRLMKGRAAAVRIVYDRAQARSRAALPRVQRVLASHARGVIDARLIARGIAPQVVRPIDIQELDLSTPLSRAAPALATLPVFLVLAAFVTGMNLAIDATAGERERRSLEALLVSPAPRSVLATGKWIVAAAVALGGVVLTLAAARAVLHADRIRALDVPVDLPWPTLAAMLLVLAPLALAVPAVQMLISTYCRSYKEGQTYLSLLLFVPMIPGFLFAFDAVAVEAWMAWTPLLAQQLAVAALLEGASIAGLPALGAAAATLAAGGLALLFCIRVLGDERRVLAS